MTRGPTSAYRSESDLHTSRPAGGRASGESMRGYCSSRPAWAGEGSLRRERVRTGPGMPHQAAIAAQVDTSGQGKRGDRGDRLPRRELVDLRRARSRQVHNDRLGYLLGDSQRRVPVAGLHGILLFPALGGGCPPLAACDDASRQDEREGACRCGAHMRLHSSSLSTFRPTRGLHSLPHGPHGDDQTCEQGADTSVARQVTWEARVGHGSLGSSTGQAVHGYRAERYDLSFAGRLRVPRGP